MDSNQGEICRPRVALVYDERMCQHWDLNDDDHPETPERIRAIWNLLDSRGITQRCVVLNAKEAEDKFIRSVHTQKHINLIRNISSRGYDSRRNRLALSFNSIYFNQGSSEAAYLAAGSVIEVAERVAKGEFGSAVAIVRPPGHHAEPDKPMGFCLFNNVAIAANYLLNERPELGIRKVLIVDWDVHHGNGTQKMFWKDPRVLFFSVHRFDSGTFYPSGDDGSLSMIGEGLGAGYNINVPWEHGRCGDADYLAVWDHVLIPVARAYNPDMILISGGFDAAIDDPLGGCCVTPYGYSIMMKKLMEFAGGRIVMVLEGGYNLNSLANSVLACVEALLEDKSVVGSSDAYPFEATWRVIRAVRQELRAFWPAFSEEIPNKPGLSSTFDSDTEDEVINTLAKTVASLCDANLPKDVLDVIQPLMKLKIDEDHHGKKIDTNSFSSHGETSLVSSEESNELVPSPYQNVVVSYDWRSIFSKINVWYGSFGSNMWKPRFLCYIEGGQVEGMQRLCSGSKDRSLPKEIKWKTVPHRLFFGRSCTRTWGAGGVAFLHPESNAGDKAYMCMYKITLEQFNDLLLQENYLVLEENDGSIESGPPLFDLSALDFSAKNKSITLEVLKGGWYSNLVYLGTDGDLPILTMTCPLSHIESFRSGKVPLCAPAEAYANTLVRGLVEGKQLSKEEALEYIHGAVIRQL
ncbi:histone deacetylase 5 [Cinnamomum micranthum f. kanehirae]|uniref:histone deacetylase n=1 Tax=Cinnamomum micranthum f. kanehirae TaxID=337451 RepID=A0A3S3N0R8_9MAGN|nr:histone deacetylase 5 [Cinnamomum micranthum f. kanehirae]